MSIKRKTTIVSSSFPRVESRSKVTKQRSTWMTCSLDQTFSTAC